MEQKKRARAFSQKTTYAPGSGVLSPEELNDFLGSPDSMWLIKVEDGGG